MPQLTVVGALTGAEGVSFSLVVRATDADGDRLSRTVTGNPAGSTLKDSVFTWTPGYTQSGTYPVTFSVSDGLGGTATKAVSITIAERNGAPVLAPIGAQWVREKEALRIQLSASDPAGDDLFDGECGAGAGE